MLFQASFVIRSTFGERVPWATARRDERRVRLGEALRRCWLQVASALLLGAVSLVSSPRALLWTLPLLLPLLASPLLAVLTSSESIGRWADRLRLFQVPEDWSTDEALTAFDAAPAPRTSGRATLEDPRACAWHALAVVGSGLLRRLPEARRAELRRRLGAGEPLEPDESQAGLTDVELLLEALAAPAPPGRTTPAPPGTGLRSTPDPA
jgi:hypothetical protein